MLKSPSCSAGFGGSWCTRCPYGTYKSVEGSQECYWCNKHSSCIDSGRCYWVDVGATTDECAVKCSPGYVLPECRTPLDQLIYTLGGPILFSVIIMVIILLLALVCFGVCLYVPACPGYQQRRRIKMNREKMLLQALRENRSRLLYYEQEMETDASVSREELSGFASAASPSTPLLPDGTMGKKHGWYTTRLLTTATEAKNARKHLHLQESDLDVHVYRIYLTGRNSPNHPWVLPGFVPHDLEPMFWPLDFAKLSKDINGILNWNSGASTAGVRRDAGSDDARRGGHIHRRSSGAVGLSPSTLYISSDLGGTSSLFSCCTSMFGERLLSAILSFLCFPLVAPFQRYCRRTRAKNVKAFLKAYSYECIKGQGVREARDCLKFDSSDDYSLAFIDVLGKPTMPLEVRPLCNVGGKPELPIVLLLAGDGSYFRPFHLDTNDIMVRSIHTAGGIGGFIHEQWVTLVSELNSRLRTVHRARLKDTIRPVLDLLQKQNDDSEALWGGLCVHLGCFWPNALDMERKGEDDESRLNPSGREAIRRNGSGSFGAQGFTTFSHRGAAARSRTSSRRTASTVSDSWMPKSVNVKAAAFQLGIYIARDYKRDDAVHTTPGRRSIQSSGVSPEAWTPARNEKRRVSKKRGDDIEPTFAVMHRTSASESMLPRGVLSQSESDAAAAAVAKFERAMALRGGGSKNEGDPREPEVAPEIVAQPQSLSSPSRTSSFTSEEGEVSFWRAPAVFGDTLKLRVNYASQVGDEESVSNHKLPYPGFLIRPMSSLQEIGFGSYDMFDGDDNMSDVTSGARDADAAYLQRLVPASSYAQFVYCVNYHLGFLINWGRPSSRYMRKYGKGPIRLALLMLLLIDIGCIFMLALYFGAMEEPAPTSAPTVSPPPTISRSFDITAGANAGLIDKSPPSFPAWFSIGHVLFVSIYPFACVIAPILGFSFVMYPLSRVGRHYASWNFLSVTNSIVAVALCIAYKRDLYEYSIAYAAALLLSKFLQAQMINWLIAYVETSENTRRRGFRPRKKKNQTPSLGNVRRDYARGRVDGGGRDMESQRLAKKKAISSVFAPSSSPSLYTSLGDHGSSLLFCDLLFTSIIVSSFYLHIYFFVLNVCLLLAFIQTILAHG